jgi:cyclopropane-fatty-acyl-phospholipid synthase
VKLAEAFSLVVTPDRNVSFRAYDGSTSGPQDNDVILEVRTPRAVEYLASSPNQLGLARAYVSGDLEIIGDAYTALSRLYPMDLSHLTWSDKFALARTFAPFAI